MKTEFQFKKADLEDEKVIDFIKKREEEVNGHVSIDKTPLVYTNYAMDKKRTFKELEELNLKPNYQTDDKDYIFHQDIEDEYHLIELLEDDKFMTNSEKEVVIQIIKNRLNQVKEIIKNEGNNSDIIKKQNKMKEIKQKPNIEHKNETNEYEEDSDELQVKK